MSGASFAGKAILSGDFALSEARIPASKSPDATRVAVRLATCNKSINSPLLISPLLISPLYKTASNSVGNFCLVIYLFTCLGVI